MEQRLGTRDCPARIAIIGAGPAGFYTADALLKHPELDLTIDIFNRFPTPFGLVRDGVAPDHQSIKAVTRIYDRIAANPKVRYFGNVIFGVDVQHAEIKSLYDQVVYAVGAPSDRRMGIPGEDLKGSYPATAFVGWYNGHPDYSMLDFDLSHERAIVVGNGNVAMDVTRILVMSHDQLAKTDIADYALEKLCTSKVREVVMLGRRGPAQAAFTNPELKEFGELAGVDVMVDHDDLDLDKQSAASLLEDRSAARNVDILHSYSAKTEFHAPRRIYMRFLASPIELLGEEGQMTSVLIERNRLVPDHNGALRARGIGKFETIEASLVLRSVGYRGVPLTGVPFDDVTYTIPNVAGRVINPSTNESFVGEYVVGWAKRGPSGVIGTNKPDAIATVAAMVEDLADQPAIPAEHRDLNRIVGLLQERGIDYVTYTDWHKLDAYEVARGKEQGCPRVKVTDVGEMMRVIRQG